ncbi:MAG: sensor histidine kinase [Candidatus Promineifilaceae bacterium]
MLVESTRARSSELGESGRRVLDILQRRNRNLRRVNEVSQKLTTMLNEEAVMGYLVEAAAKIIGTPAASLWMWEDEHKTALTCSATFPPNEVNALRNYRILPDQGVAGWVVTHGVSSVTSNAYQDSRFTSAIDRETGFITQSMLAVPLMIRDQVIGVIEILNKEYAHFDEEDLTMVETLAAAAAIAIENAKLVTSLQAQNSELDAFAHTVAHDLKHQLAKILGFSDMLSDSISYLEPEEIVQMSAVIAKGAHKMDSIIREILLLSGVRKKAVKLTAFNMTETVDEAFHRLSHMLSEYDATFITPDKWPVVCGYAPWVEEVWVNYISNAIKYGGHPPRIELGYEIEDERVWFWVKDNGKGLTEEEQNMLFVQFTRLSRRAEGQGLGLSIVRRIVSKLGGEVAVTSTLGEGSIFKFSLPQSV